MYRNATLATSAAIVWSLCAPVSAGECNPGDFDDDGDVDLIDFAAFQLAFTGPACVHFWSPLPLGSGTDDVVDVLTTYDDGTGPALYAGGKFTLAGGVTANRVAKWDGTEWSPLEGPAGNGMNNRVNALTTYDDGTGPALYAGGSFITAGGVTANRIAKWDGTEWSPLTGPAGNGISGFVGALTTYDDGTGPALYAGGLFEMAGGVPANNIAKWDGTEWSALDGPAGHGMNSIVLALTTYDDGTGPALYAGGSFIMAGGVSANNIAKWDGEAWSPLEGPSGNGISDRVHALTTYDDGTGPALYAGGNFNRAGGVFALRIARWDGVEWSPLEGPSGNGLGGQAEALTTYDDGTGPALYAGGLFTTAGGVTANRIARWDGTEWSALEGSAGNGVDGIVVLALTTHDDGTGPALYAGGFFTMAGGVPANRIAEWTRPGPPCGCLRDPRWVCDGDVDGNGTVNPVDVGLVQAAFCAAEDCSDDDLCQYDIDCNGAINPVDAGIVQSLFGACEEPRDVCP
jgi:hypothetical protein